MLDMEVEEAVGLYAARFSPSEIAIYYDFDSEEDFIKELQSRIFEPAQIALRNGPKIPLTKEQVDAARLRIKTNRVNPVRVNRLLLKDIYSFLGTGTLSDIILFTGKTKEEVDSLIFKDCGRTLDELFNQERAKARLKIAKGLFDKGMNEKDGKSLQFLAEKLINEMKPEKKDTVINMDNRQIRYVELPLKEKLEDYSKYWDGKKPDDAT